MLNCSWLPCDFGFAVGSGSVSGFSLCGIARLTPSSWTVRLPSCGCCCSGSMLSILDDVVVAGDNIIETFLGCGLLID